MIPLRPIHFLLFLSTLFSILFLFCLGNPVRPPGPTFEQNDIQFTGSKVIDSTLKMYVVATNNGNGHLTYKWFKDSILLADETTDTVVFSPLRKINNGIYICVVANEWGTDTTAKCTLSVLMPPEILMEKQIIATPPQPEIDKPLILSIVATGTETLIYEWFLNGIKQSVDNDTLLIPAFSETDTGTYQCIVENLHGSDYSKTRTILLTNNQPPQISDILDQTIKKGGTFSVINLDDYVHDPDTPDDQLIWKSSITTNITIDISPDRQATITVNDSSWTGSENVEFTVLDPSGLSRSDTAMFTVSETAPPIVSDIPDQSVPLGSNFTIINLDDYVTDEDNNDDEITWLANPTILVTVTISDDRQATITANDPQWIGSETVIFTATDPTDLSNSDQASFTVVAENEPPIVSDIPNQTIPEGGTFTVINLDDFVDDPNDPDSTLTWKASPSVNLTVTFDPVLRQASVAVVDPEWNGSETVTFTVKDTGGLSASDDAIFTVTSIGDPPVVSDIPDQSVPEGSDFTIIELDDYVTDADNPDDQITWSTNSATHVSITINADRQASITVIDPNWNGSEAITFTATDPDNLANSDQVTFTVTPVNDPPEVSDIPDQTIAEGASFTIIALDDYVHDPDNPDADITWSTSSPANLTVTIDANKRQATIAVKDPEWNGSNTVTFTAKDPGDLSASDDAVFSVTSVGDPPVVRNIPDQVVAEGDNFVVMKLDDYVTDADNSDDEITWTTSATSHLTVTISNDRQATITVKDGEWNGTEAITFTATDPTNLTNSDQASFTVTPVNDPPVVSDIPDQTIAEGDSFTQINLDDYVTDPDNSIDDISWSASATTNLTVNINAQHQATITPKDPDWNGTETVTFTARDPGNLSDNDNAAFQVTPVNDPPTITGQNPATIIIDEDLEYTIQLTSLIIDDDNPSNQHTLIIDPGTNYTIISQPQNRIKPGSNYVGPLSVWVKVSDGQYESPLYEMKFNVRQINDAPTITITSYPQNISFGSTANISTDYTDVDDNLQKMEYTIDDNIVLTNPVNSQGSHTYNWTPAFGPNLCRAYNIEAHIFDLDNAQGTSGVKQINVQGTFISDSLSLRKIFDDNNVPFQDYYTVVAGRIVETNYYECDLTFLSPEIGNLTELTIFVFGRNEIENIPIDVFTNLTKIEQFSVGFNKIKSIPSELGNLVELTFLFFRENQVQSIPKEIGQLTKLNSITFDNNQLSNLPETITNLKPENMCDFGNNHLRRSNLSSAVEAWLDQYDPDWHETQDTVIIQK